MEEKTIVSRFSLQAVQWAYSVESRSNRRCHKRITF